MNLRSCLGVGVMGLVGCSGGGSSGNDCWPIAGATPGGTIELGTGIDFYEPMPPAIQFVLGNQGGTFLILHARMTGLVPGNASDPNDPTNPRTFFSVELADGQVVNQECPGKVAYVDSSDGYFTLARPFLMPFLPFSLGEGAFDTDVKISVEIVDSMSRTARSELTVRALTPPELGGPMFDATQGADSTPELDGPQLDAAPAVIDATDPDATLRD